MAMHRVYKGWHGWAYRWYASAPDRVTISKEIGEEEEVILTPHSKKALTLQGVPSWLWGEK